MYFAHQQQLKLMMRYFYQLGLLFCGMVLPFKAIAGSPTLTPSSKAPARDVPPLVATATKSARPAKKTITPDVSRANSSFTANSLTPTRTGRNESRPDAEILPLVTRTCSTMSCYSGASALRSSVNEGIRAGQRLARVTAYWAAEGDYYTGHGIAATGVRLHDGHCAVDPSIIPYGSVVEIAGIGKFLAVDTGSAVISRTAAREGGRNSEERNALVIDLFFEDAEAGERFAAAEAKYASISWWAPTAMGVQARAARGLFAEENWAKIQSKQL
jgi:3D (Asp-Asp-Asp) domain-containing protein